MSRRCPHASCDAEIPPAMFACREHWGELPADLRRAIRKSWGLRLRGEPGAARVHEQAKLLALRWWRNGQEG